MKKTSKALLLVLCAVLLVTTSVMGTLAYLTSTDSVENAFTVGKVVITLDEAKVDEYGEKLNDKDQVAKEGDTLADRVDANKYKLIPGHKYFKDPTIHVSDESEDCWVFAKIANGLGNNATINIDETKWSVLDDKTSEGYIVYAYNEKVSAGGNVTVFTEFTYSKTVEDTTNDAAKKINVLALAVQADGFATAKAAWDVTFGAEANG